MSASAAVPATPASSTPAAPVQSSPASAAPSAPPAGGSAPTHLPGGAPSPLAAKPGTPAPAAPPTPPTPAAEVQAPDQMPDRSLKAIQAAEAKVRAQREEFEAGRKTFEAQKAQYEQAMVIAEAAQKADAEYRADPVAFLLARGFTKEDLARRLIADGAPSPEEIGRRAEESAKAEADKLRKELEEVRASVTRAENDRILREYRAGLTATLRANEEKYGLLMPSPERAIELAMFEAANAAKAGNELTNEEVLDRVLARYTEQIRTLTSHDKAKAALLKFLPQGAPAPAPSTPASPPVPNLAPRASAYNPPAPTPSKPSDAEMVARVLARVNTART